jgi:hypothetical protein
LNLGLGDSSDTYLLILRDITCLYCHRVCGQAKPFPLEINLSLGYSWAMNPMSQAASLMGHRSVEARIKAWGKVEFTRRMREWGINGGRPKGSTTRRNGGGKPADQILTKKS